MFNFKKLCLITLCAFSTPFTGLAKIHQTYLQPINVQICDFNPQRDIQSIINIFNENRHWLYPGDDKNRHWLYPGDDDPPYRSYLNECHNDPSRTIKVLQENDESVGYIIYTEYGYIEQFAIAEKCRNKGYGQLLISTAIEILRTMNANGVALSCCKNNTIALNFYKKIGFETVFGGGDILRLEYSFPSTAYNATNNTQSKIYTKA